MAIRAINHGGNFKPAGKGGSHIGWCTEKQEKKPNKQKNYIIWLQYVLSGELVVLFVVGNEYTWRI